MTLIKRDRPVSKLHNALKIFGRKETVNSVDINVYLQDENGMILSCSGTTVPTAGSAGYAKGCTFIKTDASTGVRAVYNNTGTTSSASFTQPSHTVLYAGLSASETDADATVTITVTGVVSTDLVFASIVGQANSVSIKKTVATTDTITVTLTGNGGAGTVIAYQVLRATA